MQAGTMVVAVDLPFVRSVLEASQAGIWFDDRIKGAFASALNKAIEDENLRAQCAVNGQNYAKRVFNYEYYYSILQALYCGEPAPQNIAHTRLNQVIVPKDEDQDQSPLISHDLKKNDERSRFENGFMTRDKKIKIDVSKGVFSAADSLDLAISLRSKYKKIPITPSEPQQLYDDNDGGHILFHQGQAALSGLFGAPDLTRAKLNFETAAKFWTRRSNAYVGGDASRSYGH